MAHDYDQGGKFVYTARLSSNTKAEGFVMRLGLDLYKLGKWLGPNA